MGYILTNLNKDLVNKNIYALGAQQVFMEGDYGDRHFAIIRHQLGFPDAYVEIKEDDYIYKAKISEDFYERYDMYEGFSAHCGATYYGECYWNKDDKRMYLGWDYGHLGDYQAYNSSLEIGDDGEDQGKKWSAVEILMHIAGVIADISWQNEQHWEELHALPEERDGT